MKARSESGGGRSKARRALAARLTGTGVLRKQKVVEVVTVVACHGLEAFKAEEQVEDQLTRGKIIEVVLGDSGQSASFIHTLVRRKRDAD